MKKFLLIFSICILPNFGFSQHTFSIVAVDSVTGEIGSAGATCLDNIILNGEEGALVISDIILGIGAIHTQAWWYIPNQDSARVRMEQGGSPQEIIDWLIQNDDGSDGHNISDRQYGIVDLNEGHPRSAAHTGSNTPNVAGHILGPNYAIQGNILLEQAVLDDMEKAFLNTNGTLADKLMAAMQGAKRVGADSRCTDDGVSCLSAFIRVAQPSDTLSDYGLLDLDVNIGATPRGIDPIDKLQEAYDQWLIKKYNYVHTEYISLPSAYVSPGTDTVTVTAIVENPLHHEADLYARITRNDSLLADSVSLYNDGLHNDGAASDSVWTLLIQPGLTEAIFKISLITTDLTAGFSYTLNDAISFTTIGPVQVAEPAYADTNYNKDLNRQYILLTLQNRGSVVTAEDLSVFLDTNDPRIEMVEATRKYPKIAAGDIYTGTPLIYFSFDYTEGFQPDSTLRNPVLFNVTVLSHGYPYWISLFSFTAQKGITELARKDGNSPRVFALEQNYPNPFNPKTMISYQLAMNSKVELSIYNLLGQKVSTLVNKKQMTGNYTVEWDASGFASGIYYYHFKAGDFEQVKKMVLIK